VAELVALAALALVDSINPSAIVVTLYLLSLNRSAAHPVVYVGAIFVTYFVLGVMLLLGVQSLWPSAGDFFETRVGFVVQSAVGAALLAYGLRSPDQPSTAIAPPATGAWAALIVLGITVTAMELPTAVPYFGAIALLTNMEVPVAGRVVLLAAYNLVFVLPPLALIAGHYLMRGALDTRYADLRARLERGASETARWIAGLLGGALLVTGLIELVARLR
jgi:hypothetical protein